MDSNYIVFHCHTMLSNPTTTMDSVNSFQDYANKAKELNMKAICYSEHGNVYEWLHKKEYVEKLGMKYIHGIEAYITEDINNKQRDNYHCILIARNYTGFLELNELISKSFNRSEVKVLDEIERFYYQPRITYQELKNTSDNIIISTACLGGILGNGSNELKKDFVNFLSLNKHRCFLEIQHHNVFQQSDYNKILIQISNKFSIPLIAGTDTHYLNELYAEGRKILQASKNTYFDNEEGWDLSFKSYDELIEAYKKQNAIDEKYYMQAIENTNLLFDMVEDFTLDKSHKYPKLYQNNNKVLLDKIKQHIKQSGIKINKDIKERIKYEFQTYIKNGAVDYLLLEDDIKSWCRDNGIEYGYSRGSVSGSYIAYLLNITYMDSIKHNLSFERFMNPERISLSDIDTDYPPSQRGLVKEYIYNKEGLYCADIITFNTIADKGAIRDVGRGLKMDLEEVNIICERFDNGQENSLRKEYPELFKYVDLLKGVVTSVSFHPCFDGDELVMTYEGYKKIKDIKLNDYVLTHKNKFNKVTNIMKNYSNDLYNILTMGNLPIKTTGNHLFYIREMTKQKYYSKNGNKSNYKIYSEPKWKSVEKLQPYKDWIGIAINQENIIPKNDLKLPYDKESFWWIIGRYIGDGWYENVKNRNEKRLIICCNKNNNELNTILNKIERHFDYRIVEEKTVYKIFIKNNDMFEFVKQFGKYAHNKFLTNNIFNLPINLLESFLQGYFSADGYFDEKTKVQNFNTVSKKLALGLISCINKVYKRHCSMVITPPKIEYIEGRKVNSKTKYKISFTYDKRKKERAFYEGGYIWVPLKSKNKINTELEVYNLTVDNDNSYTINNLIVHNCGTLVSPFPIEGVIGTFSTTTNKYPITQLNMKELDSLNFVKLDLLGLDSIELINETCKLANIERLTPDNINDTDQKVWDSIHNSGLLIFQWEGDYAHSYYKQLFSKETIDKIKKRNSNFKYIDLFSVGNGAIRPAGESYRNALANGEFNDNGHEALNDLLKSTNGFLVFQEQIIEFLNKFCGFSMGEADLVRRGFAKKTGTEQYIPKIKDGFIKTMQENYNTSKEEAEEIIISFLEVINDASDYLFSVNHAQAYSYIGYICAYLRYYYPLEFLTVGLNINKDNMDKTIKIIEYINLFTDIKIKPIEFGKSQDLYSFDKKENIIYKGISSIKFLNSQVAQELYQLSQENQYTNFIDLIKDIKEKTSTNSRQLKILTGLNFFSEFGKNKKLLSILELYETIGDAKQIKKDKAIELDLNVPILMKYTKKETDKLYKDIDITSYIKEVSELIENKPLSVKEQVKFEMEFLEYTTVMYPKADKSLYIITDYKTYKDKSKPYVTLRNLKTGEDLKTKVKNGKTFSENPFKLFDVLQVLNFKTQKKMKNIGGKWERTDEDELILDQWNVY